ncbi:hypothetical protein K7I13_13680 [Brucepastera parasyntrophica]|uniref:hypothetical protein n=1 Tax=Brucepastera parasyntrophica TaxID=2880008 RepID=UPI00210E8065|nr:hypothetical protein [Brucepastera parasyntrophica]ULQ59503.1 hypothetical protein K7I13_13680 [Brucepastera parasyntrophica]
MNEHPETLEYREELKKDFTKNYIRIVYDGKTGVFTEIYLYNYEYGTVTVSGGKKSVHRWEDEDEAKSLSGINRRYTGIFLNGPANDGMTEQKIISAASGFLKAVKPGKSEMEIIRKAIDAIRSAAEEKPE